MELFVSMGKSNPCILGAVARAHGAPCTAHAILALVPLLARWHRTVPCWKPPALDECSVQPAFSIHCQRRRFTGASKHGSPSRGYHHGYRDDHVALSHPGSSWLPGRSCCTISHPAHPHFVCRCHDGENKRPR